MGIKERALSLGGEVEISVAEKAGTTVRVRIPMDGKENGTGDKNTGGR